MSSTAAQQLVHTVSTVSNHMKPGELVLPDDLTTQMIIQYFLMLSSVLGHERRAKNSCIGFDRDVSMELLLPKMHKGRWTARQVTASAYISAVECIVRSIT
jgi:hypothetical protein